MIVEVNKYVCVQIEEIIDSITFMEQAGSQKTPAVGELNYVWRFVTI